MSEQGKVFFESILEYMEKDSEVFPALYAEDESNTDIKITTRDNNLSSSFSSSSSSSSSSWFSKKQEPKTSVGGIGIGLNTLILGRNRDV